MDDYTRPISKANLRDARRKSVRDEASGMISLLNAGLVCNGIGKVCITGARQEVIDYLISAFEYEGYITATEEPSRCGLQPNRFFRVYESAEKANEDTRNFEDKKKKKK